MNKEFSQQIATSKKDLFEARNLILDKVTGEMATFLNANIIKDFTCKKMKFTKEKIKLEEIPDAYLLGFKIEIDYNGTS